MNKKQITLYNMIFPIWGMILFPPLWIITLPFNFIIDSAVLIVAINRLKIQDKFNFYRQSILKVVFFGYLADVIGALFIILILQLEDTFPVLHHLHYEPTASVLTGIIMLIAVIFTEYLIYFFNKKFVFNKMDIEDVKKHKICLVMAVFTSPYIFMLNLKFLDHFIPIY